ncbi:MAG TPA: hypothetical protein DDW17_01055 [Deltaproteobacteria bacterium]|nr:hypothetical protein [Deltaproteobacteria bacterium]
MNKSNWLKNLLIVLTDIVAIYLSFILAFYLRFLIGNFISLVPLGHGLSFYLMKWWIAGILLILIAYNGGYGSMVDFWDELLVLLKSIFISFLIVWVILSLQKEAETVSRIIMTSMFVFMVIFIPCFRFFLKFLMFKIFDIREDACLLGAIESKDNELVKILNATWYSGYRIVEVMKLGSIKGGYSTCFISFQHANEELIKNIKSIFKTLIMVSEVAGLSFMSTEIKTFLSKNIVLITTKSGLLSLQKMLFKRVLDITLSLFSIIILFPLLLAISIIIKLDSRGPIFFKHKRIGKNLKEFTMYKFRTMYMDGEKTLKEFLATHPEAYQDLEERNKLRDDPRVTRWGRFLRRSSLDELPQFFNVLIGHMSIVGPRPDSREAVENYLDEYKEIYRMVRPGITGLWQVSGRSEIIYQERVKLDYLYILNWSVWLDFVIILKTIQTIISGKGAY